VGYLEDLEDLVSGHFRAAEDAIGKSVVVDSDVEGEQINPFLLKL